jgi:hypothetical protein
VVVVVPVATLPKARVPPETEQAVTTVALTFRFPVAWRALAPETPNARAAAAIAAREIYFVILLYILLVTKAELALPAGHLSFSRLA